LRRDEEQPALRRDEEQPAHPELRSRDQTRADPAARARVRLAKVTATAMRDGSLVAAVSADAGVLA
jgi:hypothetical protein